MPRKPDPLRLGFGAVEASDWDSKAREEAAEAKTAVQMEMLKFEIEREEQFKSFIQSIADTFFELYKRDIVAKQMMAEDFSRIADALENMYGGDEE